MKLVIGSRILALLLLWPVGTYLYHRLMMHDVSQKLEMSGDELRTHYLHMASLLTSPLTAAMLAIVNLLMVIFFYELLSYVLLLGIHRLFFKGQKASL